MSDIWKRLVEREEQLNSAPEPEPEPEDVPADVARQREIYAEAKAVAEQEFLDKYGFTHECSCMEDYAVGNVDIVPICFLEMVHEAMERIRVYASFHDAIGGASPELLGELESALTDASTLAKDGGEDDGEFGDDNAAV